MARIATLTRHIETRKLDLARIAIVTGCALALICAGQPLPVQFG